MLILYYLVLLVLLYIPIALLFLFSINNGLTFSFPLQGLTLHWYQDMLQNAALTNALVNSALVALLSSLAATTLGTSAAIALTRFKFKGKAIFLSVALMPLLVPLLIMGVALLLLFAALDVQRSLWSVGVAHTVISLPYTLLILMARLVGFDSHLEEAAQDLGAGYLYTLRRVVLPMISPAMLAAMLIAFTVSFDEFVLASFLIGREPTLPVFLYGQLRFANRFPQVVALAVLVMVASIGLVLLAERLRIAGTRAPVEKQTT